MPKVLEDRVAKIKASGTPTSTAYAVATKQLQKKGVLKPGTQKLARNRGGRARKR